VNWGGWDERWQDRSGQKRAIYVSISIKVDGRDFENQKVGTKVGFIAFGRRNQGSNEGVFFLVNDAGRQEVESRFTLQFKQQGIRQVNGDIGRNLGQNVNRALLMTAGKWHQWEAVLQLNALGQANGILRMWIDGVRVMDYSNVVYVTPSAPLGFNLFKWNPTWGGSGGVRTRDDYIDIDDIYLSGVPLE
jgi:hypothetical protein